MAARLMWVSHPHMIPILHLNYVSPCRAPGQQAALAQGQAWVAQGFCWGQLHAGRARQASHRAAAAGGPRLPAARQAQLQVAPLHSNALCPHAGRVEHFHPGLHTLFNARLAESDPQPFWP